MTIRKVRRVRKVRSIMFIYKFVKISIIISFLICFYLLIKNINKECVSRTSTPVLTSWSDASFNGKKTSSGKIFDSNSFTAAHKTLNFGQIIIITHELEGEEDKSVLVKINDRLPPDSPADLVVTSAVAEELGLIGKPITKLKLTIIKY